MVGSLFWYNLGAILPLPVWSDHRGSGPPFRPFLRSYHPVNVDRRRWTGITCPALGFFVKPLVFEVTIEDTRRLFGIGTDQFLISWLDET